MLFEGSVGTKAEESVNSYMSRLSLHSYLGHAYGHFSITGGTLSTNKLRLSFSLYW